MKRSSVAGIREHNSPPFLAASAFLLGAALVGCEAPGQFDFAGGVAALPQEQPSLAAFGGDGVDEAPLAVSFDIASFDRYVWRGLILTDGPVLQPGLTVTRGDLSVNVWGNMDLDEANENESTLNEMDVTLAWGKTLGPCSLSASVINYNFPNTAYNATTELSVGAALDIPANPAVNAYFDVDEAQGSYVTLDVSHSFGSEHKNPIGWDLTFDAGVGFGSSDYNKLYFGPETGATTDFHVGISFAVELENKWTISQAIIYTGLVDEEIRDAVEKPYTASYGMVVTVDF